MSVSIGGGPVASNFPFGFAYGVTIQQMPVLNSYPGRVFWLDSQTGDDGGPGTFQKPWATLANHVTKASTGNYNNAPYAGRGDLVMVKAGHAETISSATALNMSVAGIQVVGAGFGETRPKFTLDTGTTSTITVSAANVSFTNCQFVGNYAAIAALFTLTTAKGFTLNNCTVRDTDSTHGFVDVVKTSTSSNANDGLQLIGNEFLLAAATGTVKLLDALCTHDRIKIANNLYRARTTNAGAVVPIATGKVLTNCDVLYNLFDIVNAAATATAYLITTDGSTNSGFITVTTTTAFPILRMRTPC